MREDRSANRKEDREREREIDNPAFSDVGKKNTKGQEAVGPESQVQGAGRWGRGGSGTGRSGLLSTAAVSRGAVGRRARRLDPNARCCQIFVVAAFFSVCKKEPFGLYRGEGFGALSAHDVSLPYVCVRVKINKPGPWSGANADTDSPSQRHIVSQRKAAVRSMYPAVLPLLSVV